MRLKDHIQEDLVFVIRGTAGKGAFLRKLVARVKERFSAIDEQKLLSRLEEREEQISTGIGHGVAIPHATVEGLEGTLCVIAQTPEGVDFEALDASPVHVTFLLLSPPGNVGLHVRLLARIARLVSSGEFVARMATAPGAGELFSLVEEEDGRHV